MCSSDLRDRGREGGTEAGRDTQGGRDAQGGRDTEREGETHREGETAHQAGAAPFLGSLGSRVLPGLECPWLPPQVGGAGRVHLSVGGGNISDVVEDPGGGEMDG